MKEGDRITFIDENKDYEGCFTIGKKYLIKEFGEMNKRGSKTYFSWVIIDSDGGEEWELYTTSFKSIEDERDELLNKLGI